MADLVENEAVAELEIAQDDTVDVVEKTAVLEEIETEETVQKDVELETSESEEPEQVVAETKPTSLFSE